jgi:hypothetical protein
LGFSGGLGAWRPPLPLRGGSPPPLPAFLVLAPFVRPFRLRVASMSGLLRASLVRLPSASPRQFSTFRRLNYCAFRFASPALPSFLGLLASFASLIKHGSGMVSGRSTRKTKTLVEPPSPALPQTPSATAPARKARSRSAGSLRFLTFGQPMGLSFVLLDVSFLLSPPGALRFGLARPLPGSPSAPGGTTPKGIL